MDMKPNEILELIDLGGVVRAIVILLFTWACSKALAAVFSRLSEAIQERRLFLEQTSSLVRFGVYVVGAMLAFRTMFSLSKEVMTVLSGTMVVTIGLVLKDQASSVLAGIMLLIEKPFRVGDRVTFGGYYGEIRSIGLRSVRLVTLDDNEVSIPNNKFLSDPVASGNSGALTMMVQQDFYIAIDQDFARAKQIVEEALTSSRFFLYEKPWVVLVTQVQMDMVSAIRLRAKAYVIELKYEKAFESDVTENVWRSFRTESIRPPAIFHRSTERNAPDVVETTGTLELAR